MIHQELIHLPFHAGIDEAGRGPLAGPVISACVCFPDTPLPSWCAEINDSKKLSPAKREKLACAIKTFAAYGYGASSVSEIDHINILNASMNAIKRAADHMKYSYPHINVTKFLIDGNKTPDNMRAPTVAIVKGDNSHLAIAAASILAKTLRDKLMQYLHKRYPHYDWQKNMGYGTKNHLNALIQHHITPHHRTSYQPVKNLLV